MFGPFASVEKKTRTSAANWLELAQKIWNYRHDVLVPALRRELETNTAALHTLLIERADAGKLKLGIETLEDTLRRAGGTHYPRSETVEWVEFLLVAAIVIIGVRTYFVQPFQIPTNSMWPSYHGMIADVYASPADEPTMAQAALRFGVTGARARRVDAPAAGEVLLPLVNESGQVKYLLPGGGFTEVSARGNIGYTGVSDRTWLVFPTMVHEYRLRVGGQEASVRVPEDFDFDWVVRDAFFPTTTKETAQETLGRKIREPGATEVIGGVRYLRTGKTVRAGERVLSFDILAGDMLMVDRFSYHFVRPSVGDGFVFRTGGIAGIAPPETYYIKRLVGTPLDTLEVRAPTLYRNGQPITGARAFDQNAQQAGGYPGYRMLGSLSAGQTVTVPRDSYFAMGDNSPNSYDSRYWGPVPAMSVVGRPLFIYYPFPRMNTAR